jgi:hypothetical protein
MYRWIPAVGKHQTVTQKFITTTSTVFEPPTENELLGTASTDFDGRVMFVVKKGEGTNCRHLDHHRNHRAGWITFLRRSGDTNARFQRRRT